MYLDVLDLQDFYQTELGSQTQAKLNAKIAERWEISKAERVLGLGYPTPYLEPFLERAEKVLAFMPARQGVSGWPEGASSLASLTHETMLPLYDQAVDRILVVHLLEMSDRPHDILVELWRVLSPGGRLLIIVPNRTGLWARMDNTPFGHGRPYSKGQLTQLLLETRFAPIAFDNALHTPPLERRSIFTSRFIETSGERYWPRLSGAFLVDATKNVAQGLPVRHAAHKLKFRPVLAPTPQPSRSYQG